MPSLWSSLLVDFISSTNLVKEGDYGEKELEDFGFWCKNTWFSTPFLKQKVIFYNQNKLNLLLGCQSATMLDFHEMQVGGFNPFDSIRFKMGIFPKQTEKTTKHAFKSKENPDIF